MIATNLSACFANGKTSSVSLCQTNDIQINSCADVSNFLLHMLLVWDFRGINVICQVAAESGN